MGGGGVFGGFGDNNGGYAQAMQRNQAQYGQNHPKYRTKACKYFQGPGGCKNGARRALCFHISAGARPSTMTMTPLTPPPSRRRQLLVPTRQGRIRWLAAVCSGPPGVLRSPRHAERRLVRREASPAAAYD